MAEVLEFPRRSPRMRIETDADGSRWAVARGPGGVVIAQARIGKPLAWPGPQPTYLVEFPWGTMPPEAQ